ncbi:hypothetical protein Bca101_082127 [Brassica carinata]
MMQEAAKPTVPQNVFSLIPFTMSAADMGNEYIRCAEADLEIPEMDISCDKTSKDVVRNINFADYGNPSGKCEHYKHGNCRASDTLRIVKKNCLGKHKCVLLVSDEMFGTSHCNKDIQLIVQFTCTKKP